MAKSMESLSPAKAGSAEDLAAASSSAANQPLSTPTPVETPKVVENIVTTSATIPSDTASSTPITVGSTVAATSDSSSPATESFETLFPEPATAIKGPPRWFWWLILVIGSIGLGIAAYTLLNSKLENFLPTSTASPLVTTVTATPASTSKTTASPSPIVTASTTATPVASSTSQLDKSKITIQVLNGTTVAGAASKAKTKLESAGYVVKQTGNAKNQDYQTTFIYYQTGHSTEATAIQSALPGYAITVQESSLADPNMILVVIGLK